MYLFYIRWTFPPVWGVVDNTKRQQKQWGFYSVLLAMMRNPAEFGWHCWSNTAHPPQSSTTYVTVEDGGGWAVFPAVPSRLGRERRKSLC